MREMSLISAHIALAFCSLNSSGAGRFAGGCRRRVVTFGGEGGSVVGEESGACGASGTAGAGEGRFRQAGEVTFGGEGGLPREGPAPA